MIRIIKENVLCFTVILAADEPHIFCTPYEILLKYSCRFRQNVL